MHRYYSLCNRNWHLCISKSWRGSYEAVTFSLAGKNGWPVKIVRMILDAAMVVIGVLLGGSFGICTIITVLISGPIIQATVQRMNKFVFGGK